MQEVTKGPITFSELLALPGVIETVDLRSRFGFCAFHGGNLERLTDQIASEAAARSGSSFYGVMQPRGTRQHIPSAKVSPDESPKLKEFLEHCDVVVAIHGYGLKGRWIDLLVGGQNRDLARHVSWHLRREIPSYRVIDDLEAIPKRLRGVHPDNPANLPRHGGIQIELPPRVRGLTPMVFRWPGFDHHTHRFPHVLQLVEGLAAAADSWPIESTTPPVGA